jgi:hypothetical protein
MHPALVFGERLRVRARLGRRGPCFHADAHSKRSPTSSTTVRSVNPSRTSSSRPPRPLGRGGVNLYSRRCFDRGLAKRVGCHRLRDGCLGLEDLDSRAIANLESWNPEFELKSVSTIAL